MKNYIFTTILLVLLCSCAGTGTQQLIEVQDHNVSFMSPPSSWKKLYSAKSNKLPTGEVVSSEVFSVAWSRADSAAIMFLSTKLTAALPKKHDNTSALRHMIYHRAEQFEQECDSVSQSIESESEGTLKGKIPYNKIEATVECNLDGSYYAEKWTHYIIEADDYFYMTGITAPSDKHAWYLKDFNQFLDGVSFGTESGQTMLQNTRDSNIVKAIIGPLGDDSIENYGISIESLPEGWQVSPLGIPDSSIPVGLRSVKMYKAAWKNQRGSSIGIAAVNVVDQNGKPMIPPGFEHVAIIYLKEGHSWDLDALRKRCPDLTQEYQYDFPSARQFIKKNMYKMELSSHVNCNHQEGSEALIFEIAGIWTDAFFYVFQLTCDESNFDEEYDVFNELIYSITPL